MFTVEIDQFGNGRVVSDYVPYFIYFTDRGTVEKTREVYTRKRDQSFKNPS